MILYTIPKKSLGQNFLINKHYLSLIAQECIKDATSIVEVGCGTGNLTTEILEHTTVPLYGVEIDQDVNEYLENIKSRHANFQYEIKDVLKYDFSKVKSSSVVGNLPYNVGSKIIIECVKHGVSKMVFLLQREVANRIAAQVSTDDYGSLSVLIQAYYDVQLKLNIPPSAFYPAPSIHSRLVICTRKNDSNNSDVQFAQLSRILRYSFISPRKILKNTLYKNWPESADHIDLNSRAEQLSVRDYINLTHKFTLSQLQI